MALRKSASILSTLDSNPKLKHTLNLTRIQIQTLGLTLALALALTLTLILTLTPVIFSS